jgi:hypothetical protein
VFVQAAYEVEPASYAMALRTFKTETLTGEQAMLKLRGGINDEIQVLHDSEHYSIASLVCRHACA